MYKGFAALCGLCLLWGCSLDGPSWDVDVLAPGIETTLTAENLIGADNLTADNDGKLFLDMEQDVYNFMLDTISKIDDIVSFQVVNWPLGSITLPAGTQLPQQEFPLDLDLNGPAVTFATVKDGALMLTIKSLIQSQVLFTYSVPKATKNGVPFVYSDKIPASNGTDTVVYTKAFSIAGYDLDMRGLNGNQVNKLNFYVTPTLDPNGSSVALNTGQFLFKVENKLQDLEPSFMRGYFGQVNVLSGSDTTDIDFMKKIVSGAVDMPGVTMDMILENNLGANIRIKPVMFRAINSHNNNTLLLNHISIGNSVNIDRAVQTGGYPPVNPALEILHFDPMNSNLEQFLEVLPDRVGFVFEASLNPYGNVSGFNDFLYTLYPPKVKLRIQAPLKAAINNLVFLDTITYDLTDASELDNFLSGRLKMVCDNSFPLELGMNLYLVNAQGNITDTLSSQNVIQAGVDDTVSVQSVLEFPITQNKIANLKSAERMIIKARILTKPVNAQAHIRNYQRLRLKLIADIKYHVNL